MKILKPLLAIGFALSILNMIINICNQNIEGALGWADSVIYSSIAMSLAYKWIKI